MLRVMSDSLQSHGLLCSWNFPGKNTGVACHFLLQGNFPTQRLVGAWVLSHVSRVPLFATLWTVARQAPLPMGVSRQEHWSGLSCSPLGESSLTQGCNQCLLRLLHCRWILYCCVTREAQVKYTWMCKLLNDFLLCLQRL